MNFYIKLNKILKKYRSIDNYSLDYETVKKMLNKEKNALLIDVRSKQEFKEKHLDGSINISLYDFERKNFKIEDKNKLIILYCEYGERSKKVLKILRKLGYTRVYQIEGGLENI